MAEQKKLTISRNGVAIYTGPSVPPNLLQAGDVIHLGPGCWTPEEAGRPLGPGVTLSCCRCEHSGISHEEWARQRGEIIPQGGGADDAG